MINVLYENDKISWDCVENENSEISNSPCDTTTSKDNAICNGRYLKENSKTYSDVIVNFGSCLEPEKCSEKINYIFELMLAEVDTQVVLFQLITENITV